MENIPRVINRWCLQTSPHIVTFLEKDTHGRIALPAQVTRNTREGIEIPVSEWIEVYNPEQYNRQRKDTSVILFGVRAGDDTEIAYASLVRTGRKGLDTHNRTRDLNHFPWYSRKDTALLFEKMAEGKYKSILTFVQLIPSHSYPLRNKGFHSE